MRLDQFQRQNMFLPTAEVICRGKRISDLYPRLGDFIEAHLPALRQTCLKRNVSLKHINKVLQAATGYNLYQPHLATREAYNEAKMILAANPHKTTQESWPARYVSTRYPTSAMHVPVQGLRIRLGTSA